MKNGFNKMFHMLIFNRIKNNYLRKFFDILLELFKILTYTPPHPSILDKNRPIGIGLSEIVPFFGKVKMVLLCRCVSSSPLWPNLKNFSRGLKELSFCHTLKCSNSYIYATLRCKPMIFQT